MEHFFKHCNVLTFSESLLAWPNFKQQEPASSSQQYNNTWSYYLTTTDFGIGVTTPMPLCAPLATGNGLFWRNLEKYVDSNFSMQQYSGPVWWADNFRIILSVCIKSR